jgi:signal transduction histidine kinase
VNRFWRLSLRARLMIIGLTGVAVALILGGLAFYAALTASINRTLDNEALASAKDVATLVNENRLPSTVPVSGTQVIQVVDSRQRVVAGSATADRLTPLLDPDELKRALAGEALVVDGVRLGSDDPLRVRAVAAGSPADPLAVVAAVPFGDVLAIRAALRNALLITFPVLLGALAVIAYRVIGWALRPVEELRAGAEQINTLRAGSGDSQQERLPVPPAADEIRALAVTLNGMLDRLAASRERQRLFVADAAHELRSPLASMRAQIEVAERLGEGGSLPTELAADLNRLSGLVEDLLLLARADADARPPARPEPVECRALLAEVAAGYAGQRIPVTVVSGPDLSVMADADELRRAVDNLVANAVRHATSRVELAADLDQDSVVLSVRDDGPGVAGADRERVFERFTRLDDARGRDLGGSGLGLPIVRELVRRAGGEVSLTDADPPWRLAAVIRLPAARSTS